MRLVCIAALTAFAVACGSETPVTDDTPPPPAYGTEEANYDVWLESMEVGSREIYSARFNVLDAIAPPSGARVADIGAGTGLYSLLLAEAVGPSGIVYAIDIEPRFLKLINQRASDLDFPNIVSVLGRDDSITLPGESVDLVFISDTYNYFEDPRRIMETVMRALRPGGSLIILDFELPEGARPSHLEHLRVGKAALAAELEGFGFVADGTVAVSGLEETYMLRFTKPA